MKQSFNIKSIWKTFFFFLFGFSSHYGFSAEGFTTSFNSSNLIIAVVFSAFVLLAVYAIKLTVTALERKSEEESEPGPLSRIIDVIKELKETIYVLFYISLVFLVIYISYTFFQGTKYESHVVEWLNLLVRWAHVLFGIAWIGASFYFNFLENSLNRTKDLREEIAGNLWAVHGGGFYYLEKYKVAPKEIPKDLHWFKYEAYFTWLSGVVLMAIVYYFNAEVYLIDKAVMDISANVGIAIGIGTLIVGWLVYDTMCKSPLAKNAWVLGLVLLLYIAFVAYFLSHVFNSRAAYIHVGAMIGTLMVGNVFRVIIPSQKAMVAAAKMGELVNPALGKNALLRSRHNNYFTLPVIFIMISNHFPSTYGNAFNWLVLLGLSLASVLVKHYLNVIEKGEKAVWILPIAVVGMLSMAIVTAPQTKTTCKEDVPATFTEVNNIITARCVQCHSANPTDESLQIAPNGVVFDTPESISIFAERIYQRAVVTKTMPQANKTNMTPEERDIIQCWIENGAKLE